MYVRNKIDIIKTEKIQHSKEALKQRTAYLIKQGRYFEGDFDAVRFLFELYTISVFKILYFL